MKARDYFTVLTSSAIALAPNLVAATSTNATTTVIFKSIDDIVNKACYAMDILFTGALILTIVFVLLAAIKYITKGSDPKAVSEAHQQLLWAAIGFAIALVAAIVPKIVAGLVGTSIEYPSAC